ncbi:MAG: winged helix-turn-helix domain-containing protein [Thermoleophilaceae bacterium]
MEAAANVYLRAGEVEVRPAEYMAVAGGHPLDLTARELELLTALVERQGRIVSREELHRTVWGDPYRKSDRSVDVYVAKLRQKLDDASPERRFIHTHFGFGYRFQPEPARSHLSRLS